jgi:hypothetical protein
MKTITRTENYIHPDIKNFWARKYEIICENHESHQDWLIKDGKHRPTKIAIFHDHRISSDLEYKYEDKWYTKEDMLRIVNLSAFM